MGKIIVGNLRIGNENYAINFGKIIIGKKINPKLVMRSTQIGGGKLEISTLEMGNDEISN